MKHKDLRPALSAAALLLILAAALSGCGQTAATPAPETEPAPKPEVPEPTAPAEEPLSPEDIEGTLVLYTAANEQMEALLIEGFNSRYPNVDIQRVNMSSGPIAARVLAEMANPQADVIWGLFEPYMIQLRDEGAIEPYAPADVDEIPAEFVDPDNFYFGIDLTLMVIGVNTDILEERGLPVPETWEDLVDPRFQGLIGVASPAESGTGMTIFTGLYDMYGGWDYIDQLDQNIFRYNSSGGAAGREAARGEIAIGLTYDTVVYSLANEGFPVQAVLPPKTIYSVETTALIAGAPNPDMGRLWLDYLATKDAMYRLAHFATIVTRPDVVVIEDWKPVLADLELYRMQNVYDLTAFAEEWLSRYAR
jgi:iron(III) transport system substrate-binding protein